MGAVACSNYSLVLDPIISTNKPCAGDANIQRTIVGSLFRGVGALVGAHERIKQVAELNGITKKLICRGASTGCFCQTSIPSLDCELMQATTVPDCSPCACIFSRA